MKLIFLLAGDFIDLAKEEVLSLFDIKSFKLVDRLLLADLNDKDFTILIKRLALTKGIYRLLFECKIDELVDFMKDFGWNSVYKDNFCLRVHNFINNYNEKLNKKTRTTSESVDDRSEPFVLPSEKDLAKYIWRSVKKPKVNLENPRTKIELFLYDNKAYCGLFIFENKENFESRKSHLRPFPSPSSLHPKLARALINISGIKRDEILFDPFCGAGGFLIEAGLMNTKTIGYDINKIMIECCRRNLDYFKIKAYKIKNKNALKINDKFDFAVTDLPYGLNSNAMTGYLKGDWKKYRLNLKSYMSKSHGELKNKKFLSIQKKNFHKNLEMFYLKFLKNLRKKLKKKAVIVFPNYVGYKKLLKLSQFKIEKECSNYVHRSLTRKIVRIS